MDTVESYKAMAEQLLQFGAPEDNLFLQSLEASAFLHEDPQAYLAAFEEATAPPQTQLDIHLTGPGVHGHEADANQLGLFLRHLSSAAKNLAKDLMETGAFKPQGITVQGFQPGSVRIVLNAPSAKAPDEATPETKGEDVALFEEEQTLESKALWKLGAVFTESSNEDTIDEADPALISSMSPKTRKDLKNAVSVLKKNNWEIEGTAAVRGAKKQKVELTARGANKLSETLKLEEPVVESKKAAGTFTGHKAWERHELYFKSDTGTEITLKSLDLQLLKQAADLTTDQDNRVEIIYQETQSVNLDGQVIPGKVSRELRAIKPYEPYLSGEEATLEV